MNILYVGINYNSPDYAVRWARSLYNCHDEPVDIIVVDNSSDKNPELRSAIETIDQRCKYIATPKNLGYINGGAFALKNASNIREYDWIVLSNVDVELKTKSAEQILNKYSNKHDIGVIAPSIVNAFNGSDKNPYMLKEISVEKLRFNYMINSSAFLSCLYNFACGLKEKYLYRPAGSSENLELFAPYGAVIYFSKEYFKLGNNWSCPIFLYGEELYVGFICYHNSLKVIYEPGIRYCNTAHISTKHVKGKLNRKYMNESIKFIISLQQKIKKNNTMVVN